MEPTTERLESHIEALVRWKQHDPALGKMAADCRATSSLGIVGAGLMGIAIATAAVRHRMPVAITDANPDVAARALRAIGEELTVQNGSTQAIVRRSLDRLVEVTNDNARIAQCDVVLETVSESLPIKHEVYSRLQPHFGPQTVLATNTSTIPIARLAEPLADAGRFCGLHFFHPVRHRRLVEVVRGPQTSDSALATAVALAQRIGKLAIVVRDGPGFLVNRLLVPYLNEALALLLDGATIEAIDRAAVNFGMAMGPVRLLDEIGLDTAMLAGRVLWHAFPERVEASPLLVAMYKAGRVGRKIGRGFFDYPAALGKDEAGLSAPAVAQIMAQWCQPPRTFSPETITSRMLLPMVLEATRVLEDGCVSDPRDIDLGVVFGLGFPASKGGLLSWADTLGAARILELLGPLESLGPRAQPTPLLLDMARDGRRFYPAP